MLKPHLSELWILSQVKARVYNTEHSKYDHNSLTFFGIKLRLNPLPLPSSPSLKHADPARSYPRRIEFLENKWQSFLISASVIRWWSSWSFRPNSASVFNSTTLRTQMAIWSPGLKGCNFNWPVYIRIVCRINVYIYMIYIHVLLCIIYIYTKLSFSPPSKCVMQRGNWIMNRINSILVKGLTQCFVETTAAICLSKKCIVSTSSCWWYLKCFSRCWNIFNLSCKHWPPWKAKFKIGWFATCKLTPADLWINYICTATLHSKIGTQFVAFLLGLVAPAVCCEGLPEDTSGCPLKLWYRLVYAL